MPWHLTNKCGKLANDKTLTATIKIIMVHSYNVQISSALAK